MKLKWLLVGAAVVGGAIAAPYVVSAIRGSPNNDITKALSGKTQVSPQMKQTAPFLPWSDYQPGGWESYLSDVVAYKDSIAKGKDMAKQTDEELFENYGILTIYGDRDPDSYSAFSCGGRTVGCTRQIGERTVIAIESSKNKKIRTHEITHAAQYALALRSYPEKCPSKAAYPELEDLLYYLNPAEAAAYFSERGKKHYNAAYGSRGIKDAIAVMKEKNLSYQDIYNMICFGNKERGVAGGAVQ